MAGFAVAVKLVDLATGPLATINKAIGSLDVTAKKVAREGGLFEARDALKGIREQAKEVGESLTTAFRPLEGLIGGAAAGGIIGGLALMAQRFANVGTEVGRTSSSLGLNTATLQHWRSVAELAGGSAEEVTSSLANVATGLYRMKAGLNPVAFREVQRWGLDVNKGATYAERGANLMLQVSDLITKNPLLKDNPQAQRNLLGNLGIDERMLPLLQKGREALEDYFKEAERHGYLTDAQILKSEALKRAYVGLEQSVSSTALAIGGQIGTWLTPMLVKWSEWLDTARGTPAIMKTIEVGAEALAAVFGVTMVSALARLTVAINSVWALPLFRFLVANPWIAGLIAGGWAFAPKSLNQGEDAYIKAHPELFPQMPGAPGTVRGSWFGNSPGWVDKSASDLQANGKPVTGNPGIALPNPATLGQWFEVTAPNGQTYRLRQTDVGPAASTGRGVDINSAAAQMMGYTPETFPTNGSFRVTAVGGAAAAVDKMLQLSGLGGASPEIKSFLKAGGVGLDPASAAWCAAFVNSSLALQGIAGSGSDVATSFEQWGRGVPAGQMMKGDVLVEPRGLGPGQTGGHVGLATGRSRINPDTGETEVEMISGNRGVGHDVGTDWVPQSQTLIRRAPAVPTAAEPAQGAAGPQSSLDSSHKVEVSFLNAPTGMRPALTQAQGPAQVSVRTQYSMDNLS